MSNPEVMSNPKECPECGGSMLDACKGLCLNCRTRQLRRERRHKLRFCVCGKGFATVRRDAIYCSAACKQRAFRSRGPQTTERVDVDQ
jgi:hypothetical protein